MGFVMPLSAVVCALLIGWSGQVGAKWTLPNRGNSEGAPCVFPFIYKGVEYKQCIDNEWDYNWCATTSSFDADGIWGVCTDSPPAGALANAPFEVYTKAGQKCYFPFKAYGKMFNNCTIEFVTIKDPWCSTTADFDKDRQMGYCDFSRTSACGDFEKLEGKLAYDGIEQLDITTLDLCKKRCLDKATCLGLDFDSLGKCYLHFDEKVFGNVYPGKGVDHYIRQVCTTTVAPTTAVMSTPTSDGNGTCEDTFEVKNNTFAFGGESFPNVFSIEKCMDLCLQYDNETDKYCLALDFDESASIWCYLHFAAKNLEHLFNAEGIIHYTRVKCIPPTRCGVVFNKTENRLSYDGVGMPLLLSVEDCKKGCLANDKCQAFDYDKNAATKCFLHLSAAYIANTNPNVNGIDQYVRVEVPCPEVTQTTRPPTTTHPRVCVDKYTEKKEQLSYGGVEVKNVSTVDGCKAACTKMELCVGVDYDTSMKMCFTHTAKTFKSIAVNKNVNQYIREKCVIVTTTVSTTVRPTPPATTCVKEFVKTADKHAFGGKKEDGVNNVVDCKQKCLATKDCAGLDFNTVDNSCWLHDASNIEPLVTLSDIDNYKMTERCYRTTVKPTTTRMTTRKPVCENIFSEVKEAHGFGGQPCPSATTLESCKAACVTNTSCVAIDFVVAKSECWVHMPEPGKKVITGFASGINHYTLVRCAPDPTVHPTTECQETFTEVDNKHALNGVLVAIASMLEACKNACRGNEQCLAIDFNPDKKMCWIHVDEDKAEVLFDLVGVNHYSLDRRCASTASTTTTMPAECVADVTMVVDSSGSIRDSNVEGRKDNYDLIKEFLSMMVGRMRIGSQETRVAAVTYSNYAQVRIPLNEYSSLAPLQRALLDLPYAGGKTNTTGALRLARTEVFKQENGDRPNVKNIIVLITDGYTTVEQGKLSDEVKKLKKADITVFGIGVTKGINRNELKSLVSEPVDTHYFTVDDFNQLIGVLENVILGTCVQQTTPSAR